MSAKILGAQSLSARIHGAKSAIAKILGAKVLGAEILSAEVLGAEILSAGILGAEIQGAIIHESPKKFSLFFDLMISLDQTSFYTQSVFYLIFFPLRSSSKVGLFILRFFVDYSSF